MTGTHHRATALSSALMLALACGCGDDARPADASTDASASASAGSSAAPESPAAGDADRSYHRDIRPVIESNCLGCHVEGGAGPFPLDTTETVYEMRGLVVAAVSSGLMPPWPASDGCRELQDVRALTPVTRRIFEQWQEQGFAEGDERDYEPPEARAARELGEPSLMLDAGDSYTPDATVPDDYRCFLLDGVLDADTYVTAMDIVPEQRSQVHHVQIHRIPTDAIASVMDLDEAAPELGYPCFGGTGVASQNMFSWRPGSEAAVFADGDAAFIQGGSALLIQVHYNNQFLDPDTSPLADRTSIALWTLAPGELPERVVLRVGATAQLALPAGEPAVIEESIQSMSVLSAIGATLGSTRTFVPGEIIGMTPHMHSLGTRLSSMLIRGNGRQDCMIDVPDWNYHWQLDYFYMEPVPYTQGDRLGLRCEYDNSAANQVVLAGERVQPRDVTWGEGSLDEMCLNYVWLRFDRQAFLDARN